MPADDSLETRLRAATELLETIANDRALLAQISATDRSRLVQASGQVYCPSPVERRRLVKASQRQRRAEKTQADDAVLHETGIRKLRRQAVFTTPNVFPPENFEQKEVVGIAVAKV